MKRLLSLAFPIAALGISASAQAATRPATISWTCTGCTGVQSFSIYQCTAVAPATSCVPPVTGTPLAVVTSGDQYTTTETVGTIVGITIVATYPPCSPTSALTSPCGGGGASTAITQPIPPQGQSPTTIVIQIP
jgi:hypothetical protein